MNWRLILLTIACGGWLMAAEPLPWPETVEDGAELVELYAGEGFFGGPAWDPQGGDLYFTAFTRSNQQILRRHASGEVTLWLDQTDGINGLFMSNQGRLLAAQAYGHRILSYGLGGRRFTDVKTLLFDPTLHQPNDLCQTPRGDIYFTDPDFKERKTSAVYRIAPDGTLSREVTGMVVPNGLIASPKGQVLYVADSDLKHWMAFPILKDGTLGDGSVFFAPQTESTVDPDGMSVDAQGNVYLTGLGGVWVVHPRGRPLGFIPIPETCSNVTFGGSDGKTLFITCSKKLYSLAMQVPGAPYGRRFWQLFQSAD